MLTGFIFTCCKYEQFVDNLNVFSNDEGQYSLCILKNIQSFVIVCCVLIFLLFFYKDETVSRKFSKFSIFTALFCEESPMY